MASEATTTTNAAGFVPPVEPPPLYDSRPLPAGWVKEFDDRTNRNYFVDTLAEPPRSIWVHPLDDPEFKRTHPDDYDHDTDDEPHSRPSSALSDKKDTSSYPDEKKSRARTSEDGHLALPSTSGSSSSRPSGSGSGHSRTPSSTSQNSTSASKKKRGFFGKLKDDIIGTKEEREAAHAKREARRKEEERLYYEQRDAMMARRLQLQEQERAQWERQQQQYYQQQQARYGGGQQGGYAPPSMNAYGGPTYQDPTRYGGSPYGGNYSSYGYTQNYRGQGQQRGGGLGGGAGLVGGLIGGLLLGDLLF